jgi:hypothetical protein
VLVMSRVWWYKISLLFRCNNFPLYGLLVVGPPTSRTETVHIILNVIEAKLANLTRAKD